MNKKVILMILDGWGVTNDPRVSAIEAAKTPFMDSLYTKYSNSQLNASGLEVGLPKGQMGNSEVGHVNLGAGRVVFQNLVRINMAVEDGSLAQNQIIVDAIAKAKAENKKIHLMGLLSDGGVHSDLSHLKGMLSIFGEAGLEDVFVHAFTDGRDCDPKSAVGYVEGLQRHMAGTTGKLATITGRYFAMDRDNRWERVQKAYHNMVNGTGAASLDALASIKASYDNGTTDEFIEPITMTNADGTPVAKIEDGDIVISYNFRTDRGREYSIMLTQQDFEEHKTKKLDLDYITMTEYSKDFKGVKVLFENKDLENTLGEVVSAGGKKQIRIAETEKYPHVTFFFSGGREETYEGEERILIPSPKVATYDLQPEMSAHEVKDAIIPELNKGDVDFVCLNFANPDMVGHTGVFEAAVTACETVDTCANAVVSAGLENGYSTIILADHGNSELIYNADGSANTAHTTNPVPCIFVDPEYNGQIKDGKLADIAPTILKILDLPQPAEMDGNVLI